MYSLTNQEWVLVFAVLVALIAFIGSVVCIIHAVIRALKLEEEEVDEAHKTGMHKKTELRAICPRLKEAKPERVVLEMEGLSVEVDNKPPQTMPPFKQVDVGSPDALSTASNKTIRARSDEDSSTLDVEFEKEVNAVFEYEHRLAETEALLIRLQEQLAAQVKTMALLKSDRKVWFNEDIEVVPPSPEVLTPIAEPISEQAVEPIFKQAVEPFTEPKSMKSTRSTMDRSQLPPLKCFTPPRTLTPLSSIRDQSSLLMAPRKPKIMASRRAFKRPYSSIRKSAVRKLNFDE